MNYINSIRKIVGPEKIILNFAGVWIENRNGILLERRMDNGHWGLVGGAIELGESAKDAAIRECFEETGLEVSLGELIGVYTKYNRTLPNGDSFQSVSIYFYGDVDPSKSPNPSSESHEVKYFQRSSFPLLRIDQHRDIALDALARRTGVAR